MTGSTDLQRRLQGYALQQVDTALGTVQYRHAGAPVPQTTHVLLHGIGSGSGSWLMQLDAATKSLPHDSAAQPANPPVGVLAWEAPGYGASTPVGPTEPLPRDYAARVWAWLDALGVTHPITLVGHSLGALMAASATAAQPARVSRLVLLAPAQGYGLADAALRAQKRDDRLRALHTLGPQGMASKRAVAMLSPQASPEQLAFVQHIMAHVHPAGYTQATHMLSQGDVATDLQHSKVALTIASGRADGITPMAGCQALAARLGLPWHDLGDVGHACALEGADVVNALLGLTAKQTS
jgi:pimeloyl-ACP methyl ester carboxylesterase